MRGFSVLLPAATQGTAIKQGTAHVTLLRFRGGAGYLRLLQGVAAWLNCALPASVVPYRGGMYRWVDKWQSVGFQCQVTLSVLCSELNLREPLAALPCLTAATHEHVRCQGDLPEETARCFLTKKPCSTDSQKGPVKHLRVTSRFPASHMTQIRPSIFCLGSSQHFQHLLSFMFFQLPAGLQKSCMRLQEAGGLLRVDGSLVRLVGDVTRSLAASAHCPEDDASHVVRWRPGRKQASQSHAQHLPGLLLASDEMPRPSIPCTSSGEDTPCKPFRFWTVADAALWQLEFN